MSIRFAIPIVATFWVLIGCSAPAASERPPSSEAAGPVRVVLEAIVFDAPSGGPPPVIVPPSDNFDDVLRHAGARHVVGRHAIANDDALTQLSSLSQQPTTSEPVSDIERALASYRLDVTPHVLDDGGVRLHIELELAGKTAKTTTFLHDKQPIVLDNGATAEGRRLVVILRPSIIRTDADLRSLLDEKTDRPNWPPESVAPLR